MLGSGSLLMKPSASPPYDAAPGGVGGRQRRAERAAASAEALPGSTQRRIRHSSSTPRTSGTATPPSAAASPSQRSPCASAAKNPAGGWAMGLHDRGAAVGEPQLGRRRGVATGQRGGRDDRGAEQLLGVPGHDGLAGHLGRDRGSRRPGSCWRAETRTAQVRSTIASTSSKPCGPP